MSDIEEKSEEDTITELVAALYNSSRTIITEFIEDGFESGFDDIPMIIWYNTISSLCALARRLPDIKNNEKLQEAIVYKTMLTVLTNDVPLESGHRETALTLYKNVAPTIIDILIPGENDYLAKCCCLPSSKKR